MDEVELFKEELDLVNLEITEIDNLYSEIKTHYDKIKNSPVRGSLTFLEKQTSNLVSIKTAKLNLIKEKINMKKSISDINYKNRQLDNKISSTDNEGSLILESLYAKISSEFKYEKNNTSEINIEEDKEFDNNIDINEDDVIELKQIAPPILQENIEKNEISFITDTIETIDNNKEENNNYTLVVDSKGNFYKIDKDDNIIEECGKLFKINNYVISDKDESFGIGINGQHFPLVDIEEE